MDSDIKAIKYCHIIKLDRDNNIWLTIYEAISARPHWFKRKQLLEEGSPVLKWVDSIEEKLLIFLIIKCIFDIFIHYVFNAAWELPFIMWKIFHALYTLSVFKILCVDIGGIIIFKLLIYAYKMTDAFSKSKKL